MCVLFAAHTAWSSAVCYAQLAADMATDPVYADGWQAGDNGGSGLGPWDFHLTYRSPVQQAINSTSPYNQLGTAWTLFNPDAPPGPGMGTDLGQAGRLIIGNLQPVQTISVVIDNPTERRFFRGYTVRFNTGGGIPSSPECRQPDWPWGHSSISRTAGGMRMARAEIPP